MIRVLILFFSLSAFASPYQQVKMYDQKKFSSDIDKIKSCLAGVYLSQVQFRKSKGYFAALPEELKLNKYQACDGLEISTHFVSDSRFKMTAKFNGKVWSIDQAKAIHQQRE